MKTFKLFSMAALALVMAACSNNDDEIQQPAQQGPMHFTATLAAPNSGPSTRTEATADGDSYNVAWKVDDEIALVYEDTNGNKKCDKVTVKAVDGSGNATIEGDITSTVNDGDPVTLVYPYDRVGSADYTDLGKSYAPYLDPFTSQKGTIDDGFTDGLDWREGTGTFSVTGSGATLSGNVDMTSNVAIWKLNLTDGTNPINAGSVRMILNAQPVPGVFWPAIVCEASIPGGASSIYMFIPICALDDIYATDPNASITIDVMDDSFDFYDKTYNTILNLAVSKIYESSLALNKLNRLPIDDGNYYAEIFYLSTETWAEAIANHISRNRTWEIEGGRLKHNTYYLQDDGGNDIDSSTSPNSSGTYKWSDQ